MCKTLPFRELVVGDRAWFIERAAESEFLGSEFSFGNNFIWRYPYKISVLDYKGFAVTAYGRDGGFVYTFPLGRGDLGAVIADLVEDARLRGVSFCLRGVSEDNVSAVKNIFPAEFDFFAPREESDYVYLRENLVNLAGKKFHGKRNHIARFVENENWAYEDITPSNVDEAYEMAINWCVKNDCEGNGELEREFCAVKQAFANYSELGFDGGLLRLNGEVIGVTVGERLNKTTYVVHIEKAYYDIQGAYPTINREFAKRIPEDCIYINREEDDGDEGLRRAKMSYHPDIILHKYMATLKSERSQWNFEEKICV